MSHSARASWARSLIPVRRPSSSTSSAATRRPSSRANADEVGQVQLAGRRRRAQVADPAAEPVGVEGVQPGVDLADLALVLGRRPSPRRSARPSPPSLRTTRPSPAGSIASTDDERDRGVVDRRAPRAARPGGPPRPAARRRDRTRISSTSSGRASRAARSASPVPRGTSWSAVSARPGDGVPDGLGRRRVDDERAARRWRRPRRRGRSRASAGRRAGAGPWAGPTSCACRGPPRGRPRRCGARARSGLDGVTGVGRRGIVGRAGRRWSGGVGARGGAGGRHRGRGRFCGGSRGCQPASGQPSPADALPTVSGPGRGDRLDLDAAALGQRGDLDRGAGGRRSGMKRP